MEPTERTVIMYHGGCPDGFGGAYAAWKKFGNTAEYIPLSRNDAPPEGFAGAHLFFIDFTYPKDIMDRYVAEAAAVTVLDHHEGVRGIAESMPEYVFDTNRSGASIAWEYFHPGTEVPLFLRYVEEGDLYRHGLPDGRALLAAAYATPFTFEGWDELIQKVEHPESRAVLVKQGEAYREYHEIIVAQIARKADLVHFEGYTCRLATASASFISDVGHLLSEECPPLALIAQVRADGIKVSIRGDGSIDLTKLAQKYGGNGHPNSAGFVLPWGTPIPWTSAESDEDSSD